MEMGSGRWWLAWTATFLCFPIGGTVARLVAGPVESPLAALAAGVLAGVVLGVGQSLVLRQRLAATGWWVAATALGLGLGLAIGSALVDYRTDISSLALMGAFSGLGVGALQTALLRRSVHGAWRWLLVNPPLWAASWLVTTAIGVDVAQRWAVFGASGAIFYTLVAGAALRLLLGATGQAQRIGVQR